MAAKGSLQEYLQKKYLHGKKKKPKTETTTLRNCTIVDDDIDLKEIRGGFQNVVDLELGEDAPAIANIVDERPLTVRAEEEFTSDKWKVIGDADKDNRAGTPSPQDGFKRERVDSDSDQSTRGRNTSPQHRVKRERVDSDSDQSPPRVSDKKTVTKKNQRDNKNPDRRHDSDSDPDHSPVRRTRDGDSDQSPARSRVPDDGDSDQSPQRLWDDNNDSDQSPVRIRKNEDSDESPRRSEQNRPDESSRESKRQRVTLEGNQTGLQRADDVRREIRARKRKEREMFNKMDDGMSGRGAATIVRDRKTGRKRNFAEDEEKERQKKAIQEEREKKYHSWGRGLKQHEFETERQNYEKHEMSKNLARYRDDVDLDKHLKEQERDGDPMLKFLKKKGSKGPVADADGKLRYQGSGPPNRFKIPPGYRWDGVNRSNGFEDERYARINNQKGAIEDAYKWSIEDM